jgi:hypothetical protein
MCPIELLGILALLALKHLVDMLCRYIPGHQDIATGIPDSENGSFAMTGLAHHYDHFSTLTRQVKWLGTSIGVLSCVSPNTVHMRQPRNNRRIRNRIQAI